MALPDYPDAGPLTEAIALGVEIIRNQEISTRQPELFKCGWVGAGFALKLAAGDPNDVNVVGGAATVDTAYAEIKAMVDEEVARTATPGVVEGLDISSILMALIIAAVKAILESLGD